jgi:hypothetical protein
VSNVREALCKAIQGDTGVGRVMELAKDVYPKSPPEGVNEYPFVVVAAHRAPRGEFTFGGLDHEESMYLVKAVDESDSPARAAELKKRIRALLDPDGTGDAELEVEGHGTLFVSWVQDVEYDETAEGGTKYQHEGCIFEIWVEPN